MKLDLDIHGVRIRIQSRCNELMDALERDFRYFVADRAPSPDVRLQFVEGKPPWKEVPLGSFPLFRASNNTVYRVGRLRYVDHNGRALTTYDFETDEGTVHAPDARSLHEVAYLLILSRAGTHLDARGLHRLHALAVAIDEQAALFLARSGCGKTTTGLELLRRPEISWLSDEIPVFDRRAGRIRAFPLPARLTRGDKLPWPDRPGRLFDVPRSKRPPKYTFDVAHLIERTEAEARPVAVFHCRRDGEDSTPRIRRMGWLAARIALFRNLVLGTDLPRTKAYDLVLRPRHLVRRVVSVTSRLRAMLHLASMTRPYRFDLGQDADRNAQAVVEFLRDETGLDAGRREAPASSPRDKESLECPVT